MKFVCDRCGKKYATAEDPSPGKVYKLKCRACGHLIVVKAQAGTSTTIPALSLAEQAGAQAAVPPAPELEIEIEPEPVDRTPAPSPVEAAAPGPMQPPAPELLDDADVLPEPPPPPAAKEPSPEAAPPPVEPPAADPVAAPAPGSPPLPPPPPPEKDELADFAAAAAEVMATPLAGAGAGPQDLFAEPPAGRTGDDAFTAAARASLPEGYLGSGNETFQPPPPEPRAKPAPPVVAPPKPAAKGPEKKGPSPLLFVALGVVLIGVITAVAIGRGGKRAEPPPPAPVKAERPAPPEPAPPAPPKVVEQAPEAKPAPAEKRPEPPPKAEPKPKVAEKKPEPPPKVEPRPEPKPAPKVEPAKAAAAPPEPVEPRVETRDVQLPDAESALTAEVVQKVITANRKAFAGCIASAGSDVKLDGRRVVLKLTVNANGAVTYPTLDDVTLNPTEMGQCLKSAARLMIFPKFKGDPVHVEVPLTLSN